MTHASLPWATALVTGASSGIGDAITRELAARGVPRLVLVARDRRRLHTLADELTGRCGTHIEILPADLGSPDSRSLVEARLRARREPTVELLVNNAGIGTRGLFHQLPVEGEEAEIALNLTAVMRLTRAALPAMVDQRRGAVVNVSSLGGDHPLPFHATYAATKAFVTSFTQSIAEELRGTGVTATAVLPGYTRTEFQARAGIEEEVTSVPDFVWMSARDVAVAAIDAAARGRVICVPGTGYQVAAAVAGIAPRPLMRRIIGTTARRNR
jgi:short-subunit dehydrogenase